MSIAVSVAFSYISVYDDYIFDFYYGIPYYGIPFYYFGSEVFVKFLSPISFIFPIGVLLFTITSFVSPQKESVSKLPNHFKISLIIMITSILQTVILILDNSKPLDRYTEMFYQIPNMFLPISVMLSDVKLCRKRTEVVPKA
ncbi:unnamed protein product [Caenorhabditis brenneri]